MPRGVNIRAEVVAALAARPGYPTSVDEIMKVTGLSRKQVQGCVNHMITGGAPIDRIAAGNVWSWRVGADPAEALGLDPQPQPEDAPEPAPQVDTREALYAQIGRNKDGQPILRDEDGALWVADPL